MKDYFRPDIDPNTAMSQVSSLAISDLYYLPPGTIPPMVMPFDPTATVPLVLLSVSSEQYDETKLYDEAYFNIRNQLSGITGVIAPAVYGGRIRRILVYLDPNKLQGRGLSPMDVVQSLRSNNLLIPVGSAKIGELEYQIASNGMVPEVKQINDFPIKIENGAPVLVRDVGITEDTYAIQTNVVHIDGRRQVYIPIYRQPGANTIEVVEGVRSALQRIGQRIPEGINLSLVMDQSVFVRQAIRDLEFEAVLGAVLAALMVLLFLGSMRSMVIVLLSLPLSVLASITGLYFTGESLNSMTLGGLALAVGLLIDQSIVVLENISRHLQQGKPAREAALAGASEMAQPLLIISLTIAIVFFPVVFLTGVAKFLFTPLALSVVFAIGASYVLALTLIPASAARLLRHEVGAGERAGEGVEEAGLLAQFGGAFARLVDRYEATLRAMLGHGRRILLAAVGLLVISLLTLPFIGRELFPRTDSGQFTIYLRLPAGMRVERTEQRVSEIQNFLRDRIPDSDLQMIISNMGVLYDWPAAYTPNSGPQDAFINVQLKSGHRTSSEEYVGELRRELPQRFPGERFAYDTGGMLAAALNFGLPSPVNIQVEGNSLKVARAIAERIRARAEQVPGAVDVRIQQEIDYPQLDIEVDRIKAAHIGLTPEQIIKNAVSSLVSSISFDPSFWVDHESGNHYFLGVQYPEERIESLDTLKNIPITSAMQKEPILLKNIAEIRRGTTVSEVNHVNITRVTDVFVNVEGRDVGSVAAGIEEAIADVEVPPGYAVHMRGEVSTMRESFGSLGFGLILAALLVYLVMVVQFQSFRDPLVVLFAVPLGLIGVLGMLLATGTALSIQSLMGVIMMIGIVVAYSVLLVEFANQRVREGASALEAVVEAGRIRIRPILMTSLAAALGLVPMAVAGGLNAPLARAIIGGVLTSAALTLFIVPAAYVALRGTSSPER
ncbi:MAG: efflux RND transporter permease subunit [Acidobacteria bacterium]|nr:efflux RND transporter permease subunit [Acidobacteriota bacterium]